MISYKDRGYCTASDGRCMNVLCFRFLSEEEKQRAIDIGLPIAFSDFWIGCERMVTDEAIS